MMPTTLTTLILGMACALTWGAPTEEVTCPIQPFQKQILSSSLLMDNQFLCPMDGPSLHTPQFCEHLYKCPLDFTGDLRRTEAKCNRDGTWDYESPSCEDNLPLADVFLHELEEENGISTTSVSKENENKADVYLHGLEEENDKSKSDDESEDEQIKIRQKRSWTLVKPSPKSTTKGTTTPPPTTTEEQEVTVNVTKTTKRIKSRLIPKAALAKRCNSTRMCDIVNHGKGCSLIESLPRGPVKMLQRKLCRICVLLDACVRHVILFSG